MRDKLCIHPVFAVCGHFNPRHWPTHAAWQGVSFNCDGPILRSLDCAVCLWKRNDAIDWHVLQSWCFVPELLRRLTISGFWWKYLVVTLLIVVWALPFLDCNLIQSFHCPGTSYPWYDHSDGESMFRCQWLTVHLLYDQLMPYGLVPHLTNFESEYHIRVYIHGPS